MHGSGYVVTVASVSLRNAIRDLLTGGDTSALADVPPDEVAQALTSYADTAALAEADALAPIVTRASHVPFDEEVDGQIGAPLDDVHAELASLEPVEPEDDSEQLDPGDSFDEMPMGNDVPGADDGVGGRVDDADAEPDQAGGAEPDAPYTTEATLDAEGADAFGAGAQAAALDDDLPTDVALPAIDEHLDVADDFIDVGFETDVINETSLDEAPFDSGIVELDDVDDGAADDSFGDVDFDM